MLRTERDMPIHPEEMTETGITVGTLTGENVITTRDIRMMTAGSEGQATGSVIHGMNGAMANHVMTTVHIREGIQATTEMKTADTVNKDSVVGGTLMMNISGIKNIQDEKEEKQKQG